jgi:hypothetical protein
MCILWCAILKTHISPYFLIFPLISLCSPSKPSNFITETQHNQYIIGPTTKAPGCTPRVLILVCGWGSPTFYNRIAFFSQYIHVVKMAPMLHSIIWSYGYCRGPAWHLPAYCKLGKFGHWKLRMCTCHSLVIWQIHFHALLQIEIG